MINSINFKEISQSVSVKDYVDNLGLNINHGNKIICLFHNDRSPSMKVDDRFHCFGCGKDGDVIDFVSEYYGISKISAAKRIAHEFNISVDEKTDYDGTERPAKEVPDYREVKTEMEIYLIKLEKELRSWIEEYAPKSEDEEPHFLFVTAIHKIDYVSYLIDTLFELNTDEEIEKFIKNHKGEMII